MKALQVLFYLGLDGLLVSCLIFRSEWFVLQLILFSQILVALGIFCFQIKMHPDTRPTNLSRLELFGIPIFLTLSFLPIGGYVEDVVLFQSSSADNWSAIGELFMGSLSEITLLAAFFIVSASVLGAVAFGGIRRAH